jgi:hypothetical protein
MRRRYFFAFLSVAVISAAGQSADLSGDWRLNVGRSTWGSRPKPVSVILHINHHEPSLSYSGMVIYSSEDARPFSFEGAIDGKPHPMDRSFGAGTATLHRINALTFESVFRTRDGATTETTRTSISSDRKTLTRRIRVETAGVTSTSTEVYDRT